MPKRKQDGAKEGFSRRDFLKTGAAGAALTSVAAKAAPAPQSGDPGVMGPGPVAIQLRINGERRTVTLEPRVTLLDAMRNHLDLTGAKRVCDRGTCGACTVLLDGKLAYACSVLAIEAQGQEIQTVESLGDPENLHPIQTAFIEHDASQCGFCTPGFVLACKALLDKHPKPTAEELSAGLGGNLCRCGTYAGMRDAIAALTEGGMTNG